MGAFQTVISAYINSGTNSGGDRSAPLGKINSAPEGSQGIYNTIRDIAKPLVSDLAKDNGRAFDQIAHPFGGHWFSAVAGVGKDARDFSGAAGKAALALLSNEVIEQGGLGIAEGLRQVFQSSIGSVVGESAPKFHESIRKLQPGQQKSYGDLVSESIGGKNYIYQFKSILAEVSKLMAGGFRQFFADMGHIASGPTYTILGGGGGPIMNEAKNGVSDQLDINLSGVATAKTDMEIPPKTCWRSAPPRRQCGWLWFEGPSPFQQTSGLSPLSRENCPPLRKEV